MPKTAKFTIPARDLAALLAPVVPLACKDGGLPVLCGVLLEGKGRHITATATDRFRAGITRHELDAAPGPFRALVPVSFLRYVLATFKPRPRRNPDVTIRVTGRTVRVSGQPYAAQGWGSSAPLEVAADVLDGEFPGVAKVIAAAITRPASEDSAAWFGLHAALLAEFKHLGRGEALVFYPGETARKPIGFTQGDRFVGAIMPRATWAKFGEEPQRPDLDPAWSTLLPGLDAAERAA